ncbi:MAG: phosphoserine transaminase [Alphaproteobacteria bacterium]
MTQQAAAVVAESLPPQPSIRPKNPNFSSGPCAKRPGWSVNALEGACIARSHRSKPGKAKLQEALNLSRKILGLPDDYLIGIVAASDTGAVEMALWSLLGARPVDVFAWEVFGKDWVTDIVKQLKLTDARSFVADFGQLPDLAQANPAHDIVFTWNGTTSGVCVPNADWIAVDREGLTICDATSSIFALPMDWSKLDVVTYSWQKVLGGEAQHGVLILSPRAVARLESHKPSWPMPKLFRMTKDGKLNAGIFQGETINTPSMLCVEDAIDALKWAESLGGAAALQTRTRANYKVLEDWVARTPWAAFMAENPKYRSPTSVTITIADPALSVEQRAALCKTMADLLEKAKAAYDINGHRDAPPHLRIWCGATVEASDVAALTQWLDWAYAAAKSASAIA